MPTFIDADYSENYGVSDYSVNDQGVNGQEDGEDEEIAVLPLVVVGQEMPFVPVNDEQDNINNINNNNSIVPFNPYLESPSSNDKEIDVDDYSSYARYAFQCQQQTKIEGGTKSLIGGVDDGVSSACTFTSEGRDRTKTIDVDDYALLCQQQAKRGNTTASTYDMYKKKQDGAPFTGEDEDEIVVENEEDIVGDREDERKSLLLELEARFDAKLHAKVTSILKSEFADRSLGDWNNSDLINLDRRGSVRGLSRQFTVRMSSQERGGKEKRLTQDTFSFFVVSEITSIPFLLAVVVTAIQLSVFCLAAVGLINLGSPNPLNIPSDVDPNVRTTQFLLLIVAVIFCKDLIVVFDFTKEASSSVMNGAYEHATKGKSIMSLAMRAIQGTISLVVLFFLIISSDTVVEMLFNFAALEFVSQLDEAFFFLSLEGFLGRRCEIDALIVIETAYYSKQTRYQQLRKILFMFACFLALMSGWIYVTVQQRNGAYQCSTVLVQFGDDTRPELGTFSGLYDLNANRMALFSKQRVNYVERRSNGKAQFGYCPDINAWTFSLEQTMVSNATMNGHAGGFNPCNWIARSTQTGTFDLAQTIASTWYVQDENGREVVLDPFLLSCYDCDNTESECGGRGICSNAICRCDGDWFGLRCEFGMPCSRLGTDKRYDASFNSARPWSKELELLLDGEDGNRPVVLYNRPIYVNQTKERDFDVIFFTGRRWAATAASFLFDFETTTGSEDQVMQWLAHYFRDEFHAHWSRFELEFLTEPVDWGKDNDFSSPVRLRWGKAGAKANGTRSIQTANLAVPVNTIFLCSFCDETNPCIFNGVCKSDGRCLCSPGSVGALCEDAPTGNGHCDPYFNTPAWANDGGDCCESTCRSTSSFVCGAENAGYINSGYFHCNSSSNEWHLTDNTGLNDFGTMSTASTVALSFSGKVLAVQADDTQVDIFDKVGSGWNLRSSLLPVNSTSSTFQKLKLLEKAGVVWNPVLAVPAKVFVYDGEETLNVFLCNPQCGEVPFHTFSHVNGFDVSSNDVLSILTLANEVEIYESKNFESGNYSLIGNFSVYWSAIPYWALNGWMEISEDASAFALVHLATNNQRQSVFGASIVAFDGSDWFLRGNTIEIPTTNNTDNLFFDVVLADSGTVFAALICVPDAPSFVKMYKWNQTDWIPAESPMFDDIECKATQPLLEISADGRMVAQLTNEMISTRASSDQGWEPVGERLRGATFSLSGDGHTLAVPGAIGVGNVGGPLQTVVFTRPKHNICKDDAGLFRLSLTASGNIESGLGWVLANNKSKEIVRIGSAGNTLETSVAEECLDFITDQCFSLWLFGYGFQSGIGEWPASYGVFLNGELLPTDPFDHGGLMKVNIGRCSDANSSTVKNCTGGTSLVEVVAVLQDNPENLAWRLLDHTNGAVVLEGGPYRRLNGSIVEQNVCLDLSEHCFFFEVENGYPDGFLNPNINVGGLYLDGNSQFSLPGSVDRVYLGYNECCPEGSFRIQVKISACSVAEWVLTTSNGTKLADGTSGMADSADCDPLYDPVEDFWHYLCLDYEDTCLVLTYSAGKNNALVEIYSAYEVYTYGAQPSESVLLGICFESPGEPIALFEGVSLGNQSNTYYFQDFRLEGIESGDVFECSLAGRDLNVSFIAVFGDAEDPYKGGYCEGETACLTWPPATPSDTILTVSVEAIEPYTNMTIICSVWTPPAPIYLTDGVPLGNQSLSEGFQEYRLETIPFNSTVRCTLDGTDDIQSDADMYADFTRDTNFSALECQSTDFQSSEWCELPPARNDDDVLFVFIHAYQPYSGVTIKCSTMNNE